jgi:Tfp pilus assembly protein PilF
MFLPEQHASFQIPRLLIVPFLLLLPRPSFCQDSGSEGTLLRGDKAEISVTIRDSSGEAISSPANVKIFKEGMPTDQKEASHGRAFFILHSLGDYTVVVEANGYRPEQKDVSVPVGVKAEVEIRLQRLTVSIDGQEVPGKPILAPKAKEALDKGLDALTANNLPEAEKHLNEAAKLAPGHPDVLFAQGLLYINRHEWGQAEHVLEKASQMDPGNAHVFSAWGMALTDEGKYDEAIKPLEKSLQLAAGSWDTNWALAKAYYYHGQYDQALKTSQDALAASNGKAPQIQLLVAQSLTAVGRYNDAAQTLRDFLKTHGDRPEAATAQRWLNGLAKNGKIQQN